MRDTTIEQTDDEILNTEVSDEVLEAAAFQENLGVYTQMGLCTFSNCPL